MDDLFSFRNIFQVGGITMYILTFCSVLVVAVIIERITTLYKFNKEFKKFRETLNINSPLLSTLLTDITEIEDEVKREKLHLANITSISSYLDKGLPILATIGSMAPFIGLFGTVLGIIKAFRELSIQKGAGIEVVGLGIAEALICTAAGLFIAIIAVIAYNILKTKSTRIVDEFDIRVLREC